MRQPSTTLRKPPFGGVLGVIILCLVTSIIIRLADPEMALAEEVTALTTHEPDPVETNEPTKAEACIPSENAGEMLRAIRNRQTQLDQREARIEARLQALKIADQKITESTAALVEAEKRLADTLAIADEAAEKDLLRLTAVYESMKAKNAAGLFEAMAPEFAAGFLARMRADAAGDILSNLAPDKAYTISLILAGRNARAPRE